MKNAVKLIGIIALVAVIGFSFIACGGDEGGGGGGGGGNQDGGGTTFSSLVGTWVNSTGQTMRADAKTRGNFIAFWLPNLYYPEDLAGILWYEVTSYNGTTVKIRDQYLKDKPESTINITLSGTTITISGFTGSSGDTDITQFNGTYTKQ